MGLADLMGNDNGGGSTRANMGKQIDDLGLAVAKKAVDRKKKDDAPPPGFSAKAYQDLNGKWHEPGSLD